MAQKSCLITGGTGFFGIHAAKKFLSHGYKVHLLDIAPLDEPKLKVRVVYHKGDVRDKGLLTKLCKGKDVVVHAAAALPIQRSIEVIKGVNVDGTRNVLEACRINKVPRVVFISTTAVYGVPKFHPIFETSPLNPLGPYGETKAEAEKICEAYRKKGLFVSVLRPKTFLGPERLGVFQILFDWIRRGKKIYIIGNGENKYQLLAVQDLAEAVWIASNNLKANDVFNVGAKEFGTLKEDLQAVIDYAKTGSRLVPLPAKPVQRILRVLELLRLSPLVQWQYETMDKDSFVSIDKAEKVLGWHPKISNAETLIETYGWYAKNWQKYEGKTGMTHRVAWDQKILKLIRAFS